MFKVFKIKKLYYTLLIVFLLIAVCFLLINEENSNEAMALPLNGKIIIIDPGHGGIDAGAVANGVIEKELNLEISLILQKYIEESGGIAILTRTEDTNTADPERSRNISQKMSDLKERKKDIEDYNADLFISIHMNKFSESKYSGAQVFYQDDKSGNNKLLGEKIQQAIKDSVNDDNKRKAKPDGDKIYVLKDNKIPSALIECGFLSNPHEAELLKTKEYQQKLAWGIYVGIMKFLSR